MLTLLTIAMLTPTATTLNVTEHHYSSVQYATPVATMCTDVEPIPSAMCKAVCVSDGNGTWRWVVICP